MKILFFIASLPEDELEKRQFPLGVGYIGAYLEKHLQDYGNPHYKITDYLERLSRQYELCHVAETSYVSFMKNAGENPSLTW